MVTDGEQRSALAVVRSLGRAGFRVAVCAEDVRSLSGVSRFAAERFRVPSPLSEPGHFGESVLDAVHRTGARVLVPVTESSLLALLPLRERTDAVLPFVTIPTFKRLSDKAELLATASGLGIAVPRQYAVNSSDDLETVIRGELKFPVVLKPSRSVVAAGGRMVKVGVRYATDGPQLRRVAAAYPPSTYPILLQEYVRGPGIGVFLLLWGEQVLGQFAHRRIREKPPSGGVSVYRESTFASPDLVRQSLDLLRAFNWTGVAMVEYKVDAATRTPYLMEVNGRFWGSLQLAVDAGVDFPRLLVQAALGRPEPSVGPYRTGTRSRWWWGDVDHLIARLKPGSTGAYLPPGTPGRLGAVAEFLKLWRPGDHSEVLRWNDPLPFVIETARWLRGR